MGSRGAEPLAGRLGDARFRPRLMPPRPESTATDAIISIFEIAEAFDRPLAPATSSQTDGRVTFPYGKIAESREEMPEMLGDDEEAGKGNASRALAPVRERSQGRRPGD